MASPQLIPQPLTLHIIVEATTSPILSILSLNMSPKFLSIFLFCLFTVANASPLKSPDTANDVIKACNPPPTPDTAHYIIGYGSLVETASKTRTFKNTGENIPVQVKGFRREWNLKGDGIGPDTTYLGVVQDEKSSFNGVIFQLPATQNIVESLKSYDEREHFYCRHQVPLKDITVLGQNATKVDGQFWIYVNKPQFVDYPSRQYPIAQSYVDVFLSGCIELQEKFNLPTFAKDCVSSTKGWTSQFWVNDRIYPRRPFVHQPKAGKIDKALMEALPNDFDNIRIEGTY